MLFKQILLTDFPEMAIAGDRVDAEYVEHPRRWENRFIRRFMVTFGLLSSLFDYLTFGLLLLLRVSHEQFRAGWFVESVVSAESVKGYFLTYQENGFRKVRGLLDLFRALKNIDQTAAI